MTTRSLLSCIPAQHLRGASTAPDLAQVERSTSSSAAYREAKRIRRIEDIRATIVGALEEAGYHDAEHAVGLLVDVATGDA